MLAGLAPAGMAASFAARSKSEILRLSLALPGYPRDRTFGPCRPGAFRRSGNGPCRRHASPSDAPRNPTQVPAALKSVGHGRSDRLNLFRCRSRRKRWPLLVSLASCHGVRPQRRDNGLNQKIYRLSPDGVRRFYRRFAGVFAKDPGLEHR